MIPYELLIDADTYHEKKRLWLVCEDFFEGRRIAVL